MEACCIESCWDGLQLLVWIYLQLLVEQQMEEEEEEVQLELHCPAKSVTI